MVNMGLLNQATAIAERYLESEGIMPMNMFAQVANIYNNSEITNPQTLAAVAIDGHFDQSWTWRDIQNCENFYFPSAEMNYHISEIEGALRF